MQATTGEESTLVGRNQSAQRQRLGKDQREDVNQTNGTVVAQLSSILFFLAVAQEAPG